MKRLASPLLTPSLLTLLLVNVATIVIAILEEWSLPTILWSYWAQSVIIGLFQYRKMLDLKNFSTEGLKMNGKSVSATETSKKRTARFFILHYGFFHFVYALLLGSLAHSADWRSVLIAGAGFFANHWLSYRANKTQDETRMQNIGHVMIFPYLRILPMHFFVVFSLPFVGTAPALIFFLSLKTAADAAMHVVEHRYA